MKLDILSENLFIIINKIIENQDIVKMVNYDVINPLLQPAFTNPKSLFMTRIFPYPYSGIISETQTQIRVYYGKTNINIIEQTPIIFDILTHESLYMIKDQNNVSLLRPYEIANRITQQFDKNSIGTIGVLKFSEAIPIPIEGNYQMLRLIANMMTIGK